MLSVPDARKLLEATPGMSLKELNTLYKGLMKRHHPDRFQDATEREEAEVLSQRIIAAYKLLESLHPETHAARAAELEAALASNVSNWDYKGTVLSVTFGDGSVYAFQRVQRNTYNKFVSTNGTARFVRRHLAVVGAYRKVSGPTGD